MATRLASVDNALRLLLMLQDGRPLRVTDAAQHLGVSRPTAHRLLASLAYRRFVEQDPVTRAYLVADALVRNWVPPAGGLLAAATPELRGLARRTGAAAQLGLLRGTTVTIVASVDGARSARNVRLVGTTFPAHFSAAGKALLAELSAQERERRYAGTPLRATAWHRSKPVRQSDDVVWSTLATELADVQRLGYATNFRPQNRGINAVAVAILVRGRPSPGAVVLSAPSARIGRRALLRHVQDLRGAAAEVAARLSAFGEVLP